MPEIGRIKPHIFSEGLPDFPNDEVYIFMAGPLLIYPSSRLSAAVWDMDTQAGPWSGTRMQAVLETGP